MNPWPSTPESRAVGCSTIFRPRSTWWTPRVTTLPGSGMLRRSGTCRAGSRTRPPPSGRMRTSWPPLRSSRPRTGDTSSLWCTRSSPNSSGMMSVSGGLTTGKGGARSLRPPGCSGRRRALVGSRCLPDAARCAPWAGHRGAQGDQQAYPVLRPRSAVVVRITRTSAISPRPAHPTGARRSPTTATASRAATAGSARVTVVAVLGDSLVRP